VWHHGTVRRLWAVGILTAALVGLQVAAPAMACGCGGIAVGPNSTVTVEGEAAIVSHADGIEQIDLSLALLAQTGDTGLVFPTPTPATVENGSSEDFDKLLTNIAPRPVYVDDWWGLPIFPGSGDGGVGAAPEILSQVQLGPIEATTLRASDTAGLNSWLKSNEYTLSSASKKLLDYYVKQKWSFVAVKITSDKVLDGTLDPIRITFESEQFVYPMRLSAGAETTQHLRLYILDDERAEIAKADAKGGPLNAARTTVWAGPVDDPALARRGEFLTVIDVRYDDPKLQVTSDIAIVSAGSTNQVIPVVEVVRPIVVLGVPVGTLIVGWTLIGLLVLFGAFVARTRTR